MKDTHPGILTIAAAPIGCLDDASPRLAAALAQAQIIAAEDTRRLRRLAAGLGVPLTATVVSYYDAVEQRRVAGLAGELAAGRDVLLVTDAGLPGVSDPGYRLVAAAVAAGVRVSVLPGPSAVTAALAVSGLPSDRFCFEGFPPRRAGERARRLAELATEPRTMVFFESPRRLAATLAELAAAFGAGRPAVVCRELTKTHEEVRRGPLAELAQWAEEGVRGEVTLVLAGAPASTGDPADLDAAADEVAALVAGGTSRKDAVASVAAARGLRRRALYEIAVSGGQHGHLPVNSPSAGRNLDAGPDGPEEKTWN
ncbi:MAG TPA: 16S rRNA (cytidine(1402)-2'-O)-methyltransferase [Streptosporangiaceae bacterium]|jgi:16S rRNA (cytidine1402-2'-O)-methyltransferase|nr:16S rRNA (cytidine(1402)-2'-O)-methyltransferase [Streptosporangiaceae bacterium]